MYSVTLIMFLKEQPPVHVIYFLSSFLFRASCLTANHTGFLLTDTRGTFASLFFFFLHSSKQVAEITVVVGKLNVKYWGAFYNILSDTATPRNSDLRKISNKTFETRCP